MRPTFAVEIDAAWLVAATTALLTVFGFLGAGIMTLLNWWGARKDKASLAASAAAAAAHKQSQDDETATIDKWKDIVTRLDAHNQDLQKGQDECQKREARLSRIVVHLYGKIQNMAAVMADKGMPTEPLIDLAELLGDPTAVEFTSRTRQQGTASLHEEAKQVVKAAEAKP